MKVSALKYFKLSYLLLIFVAARADIFTSLIISPRLRGGFCVAFGELLRRFARVFAERLNKIALA